MSISTSGVGSGLDIKGLVEQLVEAEGKSKKISFDKHEAVALSKMTGYGTLKSALKEFQDTASQMLDNNPFEKKSAIASTYQNNQIVNASAASIATAGTYSIEVIQLAFSQKMGSIPFETSYTEIGTGTIVFSMGFNSYSFNITSQNNTLQQIAATINQSSLESGITASLINSDLGTSIVFNGPTGLNNVFTISVDNDADLNNTDNMGLSQLATPHLSLLQAAQNAQVKIEGVTVSSDSNTIKNAISGVEIDLLTTNVNNPISLTIHNDLKGAYESVERFIEQYNSVFDSISQLTKYQDGDNKGILIGDATVRNIQSQLRRTINNVMSSQPGGYQSLAQIGLRTDEFTGKLFLSNKDFSNALKNNYQAVGALLMDPSSGVLENVEKLIMNYVEPEGILQTKTDGLNKNISILNEQRIALERHLIQMQSRLISQFVAMDGIVARFKSLSEFLEKQMESLPKPLSFRK